MKFGFCVILALIQIARFSFCDRFSVNPKVKCGESYSGKLIEIDRESNKLYKICVNPPKSETYFVYHNLDLRVKLAKVNESQVCKNIKPELSSTEYSSVADLFDKERNREYFEKDGLSFLNGEIYFEKLQLAPCEDFSDILEKQGTFFVENIIPSFNVIVNGNWALIEDLVRNNISEDTEIVTGQFGQLELSNDKGERIPIVLEDTKVGQSKNRKQPFNEVKVPEFLYKIVKNSKNSMVIITSNNPFLKKIPRDNRMCSDDLCPAPQQLKDFSSGYTYCCNLEEFVYNMKRKYNTEFNGIIFPQKDIKFFEQESKKKTDLGDNLQRIID